MWLLRPAVVVALISVLAIVTEGRAAPCEAKGLDTYLESMHPGFSCTSGPLTLSNFAVTGDVTALTLSITVAPVAAERTVKVEFQFSSPFSLASMEATTRTGTFEFQVMGAPIEGVDLTFKAKAGTGTTAQVDKTFTDHDEKLQVKVSDDVTKESDSVDLPDSPTSLAVTDTLLLKTINTGDVRRVQITAVTDAFRLPAPSSLGLAVGGTLLLALARRRRRV